MSNSRSRSRESVSRRGCAPRSSFRFASANLLAGAVLPSNCDERSIPRRQAAAASPAARRRCSAPRPRGSAPVVWCPADQHGDDVAADLKLRYMRQGSGGEANYGALQGEPKKSTCRISTYPCASHRTSTGPRSSNSRSVHLCAARGGEEPETSAQHLPVFSHLPIPASCKGCLV